MPHSRRGFTLVEMLTTVALLIIVLGLMVSLARYVRRRSAEDLTRRILLSLDKAMRACMTRMGESSKEQILKEFEDLQRSRMDEAGITASSLPNNHRFVALLQDKEDFVEMTRELPQSIYEPGELRDAWGMPIVFMPRNHPAIGMAPRAPGGGEWFFFSAGPDRLYLTRDDNQYSYEASGHRE